MSTLLILITNNEIVSIERDSIFNSSFHSMYDINKLHNKFFKEPTKDNFVKVTKEYIPDSKKLLYVNDIEIKSMNFNIDKIDSGTLIFNLSSIQNEDSYFKNSIVIFNTLSIDVSLRSINYNIDGKLVGPKSIFRFPIVKYGNK